MMVCARPLQDRMAEASVAKQARLPGTVTFQVVPTSVVVGFVTEFPGDEPYP